MYSQKLKLLVSARTPKQLLYRFLLANVRQTHHFARRYNFSRFEVRFGSVLARSRRAHTHIIRVDVVHRWFLTVCEAVTIFLIKTFLTGSACDEIL